METFTRLPSSKCPLCPLYSRLRYNVPATRVPSAELVFVGEAPGESEVKKRRGFVGSAGKYLDAALTDAGIDRSKCTVTNVLKCQPEGNKLPEQLGLAIECCREILEEDVKGAKVIVGLGNVPLKAFTRLDKIALRRGSVYPLDTGQLFLATVHPSYMVRSSFAKAEDKQARIIRRPIFIADLVKARRIASGELDGHVDVKYILYPTQTEKEDFLRRLRKKVKGLWVVGADIESSFDRPHYAVPTIITFSLLNPNESICASFEDDVEFIHEALASPCPKVFFNGIFDVHVLENCGFEVVNWDWDLMYLHHLCYAELAHNLGFVQSTNTCMYYHKDMVKTSEMEEAWEK